MMSKFSMISSPSGPHGERTEERRHKLNRRCAWRDLYPPAWVLRTTKWTNPSGGNDSCPNGPWIPGSSTSPSRCLRCRYARESPLGATGRASVTSYHELRSRMRSEYVPCPVTSTWPSILTHSAASRGERRSGHCAILPASPISSSYIRTIHACRSATDQWRDPGSSVSYRQFLLIRVGASISRVNKSYISFHDPHTSPPDS